MKKALIAVLILAVAFGLFADSSVLPKGVFKADLGYGYLWGNKAFNEDGDKVDTEGIKNNIVGASLQYGITDFLSIGVGCLPLYCFNSQVDPMVDGGEITAEGTGSVQVGVKFQLVGNESLVQSDNFGVSFSGGVYIPTVKISEGDIKNAAIYDLTKQLATAPAEAQGLIQGAIAQLGGPNYKFNNPVDTCAFAVGGRVDLDWRVFDNFCISLGFDAKKKLSVDAKKDLTAAGTDLVYETVKNFPGVSDPMLKQFGIYNIVNVDYGMAYSLQLSPSLSIPLGTEGNSFGVSVPVTASYTAADKHDGEKVGKPAKRISVAPGVGFTWLTCPLPMAVSVGMDIPVLGNSGDIHKTVSVTVSPFFAF